MTVKILQTKAEYKAALKAISALIDVDSHRGAPEAEQLESLGALIEAHESKEMALMMLNRESRVMLSERDFAAFSEGLGDEFKPNEALKGVLAVAKELVCPVQSSQAPNVS